MAGVQHFYPRLEPIHAALEGTSFLIDEDVYTDDTAAIYKSRQVWLKASATLARVKATTPERFTLYLFEELRTHVPTLVATHENVTAAEVAAALKEWEAFR